MNAKELKSKLDENMIIQLMEHMGADYRMGSNENEIHFRTVCHCGDSYKLYYYKESKTFQCYSNCGTMDIISVVSNTLNKSFLESLNYICDFFGFDKYTEDFSSYSSINKEDWNFLSLKRRKVNIQRSEFKYIDESILDLYYDFYHPAFYNDGITFQTMKKFEIKYDILEQRIIIPHRDEKGNLIAVRCRNTKEELISTAKYMPIVINNEFLSAKITNYFYGLYYNQENIRKAKKVIIVEAEKSVMQLESILDFNISIALSSSSLSAVQIEILKELGVEEVIIAVDKEFETYNSSEEVIYSKKVFKGMVQKLKQEFNVSVIWDKNGLIGYKDSPTDAGKEIFMKLFEDRIEI